MEKDHYISDLAHIITGLGAREERALETIRTMDRQPTLIEDATHVARLYALRSVRFELEEMKAAWVNDHPKFKVQNL